ncbi:hypothetical protein [Pseudomonas jilinensis]|uniref:Uncharacterized protein n=1 Tax=Pseudomonas jilinensis TaxID=2078689 RepID=A0A396RXU4_9PSED|nr:hypothetical protein [Pseudomonas jilinensis]RHW21289.1 hypothetical protein C2846_09220 [Pseudomonas jilinensis]
MSNEKEDFRKKLYFDLKEAVNDISFSCGAKEKTFAGAKLLGKTLFNTTLFLGTEIVKNAPKTIASQLESNLEKNPNIDPERRKKMEAFIEKHKPKD